LASLSINPATALRLLDDFVQLQKGDVIIQNAANSMVGTSVIQIANARGIKTINIIRKRTDQEEMVEKLKSYGAYIVCTEDYLTTPEFRRLVSDLPKPKLALNGTGGPVTTEMARLLADNGTLVTYGAMARQPITVPSSVFLFKNIQLKGFWLSKWLATHSRAEREKMYADLVALVKAGKLRMWLERHSLANFSEALARAQQPFRERKVLLVLDSKQ
jgi:trans-2-enoyl-CoA reductase